MKFVLATSALALATLAGCASTASAPSAAEIPAGMKAGEFVAFQCEGGKRLMARAAADGASVRVRYEGGYELDRKGPGMYAAEGWELKLQGKAAELAHNGKTVLKNCQPA